MPRPITRAWTSSRRCASARTRWCSLYLYVTDDATLDNSRVMKYCNAIGCVDESLTDPSLASSVDLSNRVVFRRIKHFSGYIILQLNESVDEPLGLF